MYYVKIDDCGDYLLVLIKESRNKSHMNQASPGVPVFITKLHSQEE